MYFKLNVDRLDCVCLKHTEAGYPVSEYNVETLLFIPKFITEQN